MEDIDVSECCYLINHDPPKGQGTWCGAIHKGACKVYSKDCKYNENCYYKQLKRTQNTLQEIKEIAKTGMHCEGMGCDFMPKILDLITKAESEG